MPTDIETALAATDLDARVPRLVAAVVRWVPGGAALPTWSSLEEGATSLALPAEAAAAARERLSHESVQRALYALESLDAGADVVSVLGGLGASLRLYLQKHEDGSRGGIAALDRRQREDAATKLYTLSWCTSLLFGGPAATQLDALRAVPAGRSLLAWVGAIELLLPFTQEIGEGELAPLILSERTAARERFARAYGEEAAALADIAWEPMLGAALELGSAGTMIVGGITGVVGKYLPTVVGAVDFSGAVAAGAFDALPVYHLLGARLVAEAALVGPAKVPELPPVLDAPATPPVEGQAVADEPSATPSRLSAAPTYPPELDAESPPFEDLAVATTFAGEIGAEPTFTAEPIGVEPRPTRAQDAEPTFSLEITGEHAAALGKTRAPTPPTPDDDIEPSSLGGIAAAAGVVAGIGAIASFAAPPPPPPVRTVQPEDAGPPDDGPVLRPLTPGLYSEAPPPEVNPPKELEPQPLRTFVPTPTAPPEPVAKPAPPPLPPVAKPAPPPLPEPAAKPAPPPLPPVAKPAPPPVPEPAAKAAPPPVAKPAAPPALPPVAKPPPPPVAKPAAPPPKPAPPVAKLAAPPPKKSGGGWLLTLGGLLVVGLGCAGVGGGALAYAGYSGMIDLSALGIGSSKSSTPSTPTTPPSRPTRPGGKPGGRR